MLDIAKKQNKPAASAAQPDETGGGTKSRSSRLDRHKASVMVRLPRVLADLLEQLQERNVTDRGDEVVRAVREYLERNGLWPPRPDGECTGRDA